MLCLQSQPGGCLKGIEVDLRSLLWNKEVKAEPFYFPPVSLLFYNEVRLGWVGVEEMERGEQSSYL